MPTDSTRQAPRPRASVGGSTLVHIYASELDAMAGCMAASPDLETGGDLFGLFTREGAAVVLLATGPGPRARHNPASFFQDTDFLESEHRRCWELHGLVNIGAWHSHHHIAPAHPSFMDVRTVWDGLATLRWSQFLLAIGAFPTPGESEVEFGLSVFHAEHQQIESVGARVLPGISPYRILGTRPGRDQRRLRPTPEWRVRAPALPWAARPESRAVLHPQLKSLARLRAHGIATEAVVEGDGLVIRLSGERVGRVILSEGFPAQAPVAEGWPRSAWRRRETVADWVAREMAAEERAAELVEWIPEPAVPAACAAPSPADDDLADEAQLECWQRVLALGALKAAARAARETGILAPCPVAGDSTRGGRTRARRFLSALLSGRRQPVRPVFAVTLPSASPSPDFLRFFPRLFLAHPSLAWPPLPESPDVARSPDPRRPVSSDRSPCGGAERLL